jgi:cytochrome c553
VQWSPADVVDHTQVVGTCGSCHNGAGSRPPSTTRPSSAIASAATTASMRRARRQHTSIPATSARTATTRCSGRLPTR